MAKLSVMEQDMPYEKFLQYGAQAMTDRELLAIILRTGTKEKSALSLASEVLELTHFLPAPA